MIEIPKNELLSSFQETGNAMFQEFKDKSKEYVSNGDQFKDFRLSEDLGILPIEKVLFLRGVTDKLSRIGNLFHKENGIGSIKDEPITKTYLEIANYIILIYSYIRCKENNDFSHENTSKFFTEFLKECKAIFESKNDDYSGNSKETNGMKNFSIVEQLGLCSIEEGILSRILIKINRIANFLGKGISLDRLKQELIDMVVYLIILHIYIIKKQKKSETKPVISDIKENKETK